MKQGDCVGWCTTCGFDILFAWSSHSTNLSFHQVIWFQHGLIEDIAFNMNWFDWHGYFQKLCQHEFSKIVFLVPVHRNLAWLWARKSSLDKTIWDLLYEYVWDWLSYTLNPFYE